MLRIPLPIEDYEFLLAPRWPELAEPLQFALLVLLLLAPAGLVLWLYRSELCLIRSRAAFALLSLRLLAILVLWALVALQPVVTRSTVEELPGRVLIAVDRSASTDVPDPQRPVLAKLRLARALSIKASGDLPSNAQLNSWIKHYERNAQAKTPPRIADDEDPQHLHDEVCRRVDKLTRAEVAQRILNADGLGLLQSLRARHDVELVGFHKRTWDVQLDRAADIFLKVTDPGVSFTDLRKPLSLALERSGPDQGRMLGIVLLTDGQHNWGPSPVKKAAELGERQIPIFPIALGARGTPPDVILAEVTAPANVFKGTDATVEARFKVNGLPAQDLKADLRITGKPPLPEHIQTVRHDGTDRFYTVRFQVRMDEPGTQTLEVRVRPPTVGREITDANNQRSAVVRVAGDRARVLLIDGEARWEQHYLASALQRDRTVQVESVIFAQPRLGQVAEAELEKAGNPRLTLPLAKEGDDPLLQYDCIVLGDVSPTQLPAAARLRLERYVADRGGTLVILAGKRHMPLDFVTLPGADGQTDPLVKMLPIEEPHALTPAAGFPVTLTHDGSEVPFLQLDSVPAVSLQRWAELPRHYWGVVGRAKPGAASLAYIVPDKSEDQADEGRRKDGPERTRALIVRQNYGFGRVLFVGLDSTWRWRYRVGDQYHHRVWGQVVRWAASDQMLPAGNKYVRFGSREPVYREGQPVDLAARLADEVELLPPGAHAMVRVLRQGGDGKEEAVPLTSARNQPRLLQGQVLNLTEGQYRVVLDVPALAEKLKVPSEDDKGGGSRRRDTFTVLPSDSAEMFQLATNGPLLDTLAARSGGRVFTPEDAGQLVDLLEQRVERHQRHDDQHLSESRPAVWWVLGLFLGLLTLEWVGRKLAGLP